MNVSALPQYPGGQNRCTPTQAKGNTSSLSPEGDRVLLNLAWLIGILVLLWFLRRMTDAIERSQAPIPPLEPFDFRLIEKRYIKVPVYGNGTRQEVEQLLGPPTEHCAQGPELVEAEEYFSDKGRIWMPNLNKVWDRWSDPSDPNRWVAVMYEGNSELSKAYAKTKRGFQIGPGNNGR